MSFFLGHPFLYNLVLQQHQQQRTHAMPKLTPRSVIQKSAIAASTITLAPTIIPAATDTVFHVFAFQWKPNATEAQKEKAAKDIAAFQGQIPGLLQTHVGPNISPRSRGYTFGGIMQFKDQAALDAYVQHPSHQSFLAWLVPLIDAIELDLRA
jgi:stress responsive alpha/beta barrel protein